MKQLFLILLALTIVGCAGAIEETESGLIAGQAQLAQEAALALVEPTPTLIQTSTPPPLVDPATPFPTSDATVAPTLDPNEEPTRMPTINLTDTKWELSAMPSGMSLNGVKVILEFRPGNLQGNAGCNSFSGKYEQREGDNLTIYPDMISTDMWCEFMDIETEFLSILPTVERISSMENDQLTLTTPTGDLVFVKPVPLSLEGTLWSLNGMLNTEKNGFVSMAIDQEINLMLGDARVGGYTGCNQMMGSYTLAGDSIKFEPIGITRRACPEEKGPREFEYVNAFQNVERYEIDGEALKFFSGDGTLLMQFLANN